MISYQFRLDHCYVSKDKEYVKSLFFQLLDHFNLHVRNVASYEFYPFGITTVAILAESDARIHTWPEKDIIDIDIYYCGDGLKTPLLQTKDFVDIIFDLFKPGTVKYVMTDRHHMIAHTGSFERT